MKRVIIDKSLCMGCLNCTIGCMSEHGDGSKSIYELDLTNTANEGRNHISLDLCSQHTPIVCRHCDEPECVMACMTGAMAKDDLTGVVTYDKEHCAACFMCVMSCPYGVLKPSTHTEKKVLRCDRCGDREIPRCVEDCPTEALSFVEVDS